MQVTEAVDRVIAQLDVGEGRYPAVIGEQHVNQAMVDLSREYQFSYDSTITTYTIITPADSEITPEWERFPGSALLRTVLSDSFIVPDFVKGAWLDPETTTPSKSTLVEPAFNTMMRLFGDQEGTPEAFCIHGNRIYWRPIPASGTSHVIRFSWKGFPRVFGLIEEPSWLVWAPYAVIYKACEIASVWLVEDNRVPTFIALRKQQMDSLDVVNSMRGDSMMTAAEEPG